MPRGGYRPGAGRPKGSKNRAKIAGIAAEAGLSPLEYMLAVMRDETADPDRRIDMAIAAAPYLHSKVRG